MSNTAVTAPTNKDFIHKDELTDVAVCFDCISYLVQEIDEDYFARFDSSNADDVFKITWDYNRNRAKINAVARLLYEIEQVFKKNDITAF